MKLPRRYQITIELEVETIQKGQEEIDRTVRALGYSVLETKHLPRTRTSQQNKALHKWLTLLAEELKDKDVPVEVLSRKVIELDWTMELLKIFWRDIQKKEFGEFSTTKLKRYNQIDLIYDIFNRWLIEECKNYPIQVPPFPCKELREEEAIKKIIS